MPRLLFVCSRNRLRSPTAEHIFNGVADIEAMSAGVAPDADNPLTAELIEWADVIFAMEQSHQKKITRAFNKQLRGTRLVCLAIADDYEYVAPELVQL